MECTICNKTFSTSQQLNGHKKVHSPNYEAHKAKVGASSGAWNTAAKLARDAEYALNPKKCLACGAVIPREKRASTYCSRSCRTKCINGTRKPRSELSRKMVSDKLKIIMEHRVKKVGPYSRLVTSTCRHCGLQFVARRRAYYCLDHVSLYGRKNRNRYAFAFSIRKYAGLFQDRTEQLRKYGLWSYDNTNGLTRDHRVSVIEAIKNGYDPFYITHPLNCELMPWIENDRKKGKSSIRYADLVKLVDAYEMAVRAGIEPAPCGSSG
jgi:ferredoxin